MRLTVAAKRNNGNWEGAVVADGKFQRALSGDTLSNVLLKGLASVALVNRPEGTDVVLELVIEEPKEQQNSGPST